MMLLRPPGMSAVMLLLIPLSVCIGGCGRAERAPLPCMERAVFDDPAGSPYVLPYPVGASYRLAQSYCYPYGGHRDQLAYDFDMPIGSDVVAARAGVVRRVREDLPDTGDSREAGQHNNILIEHDDGTVAFYGHLKQNGVAVEVGQRVAQGQRLAASGNSGNTLGEPHLHFGVYQSWPATEGFDVAVNFRNAEGPLDERRGLAAGAVYKAQPY
ncbi:MAG: M23 family metallopeptidase [Phycisphaerales bacterium]|nr:MAG: M23 family metallopeptidase [Phycisphaerales bacterium]